MPRDQVLPLPVIGGFQDVVAWVDTGGTGRPVGEKGAMPTFSEVQQPIICWNCKAVVNVPEDQLRSASCNSCMSGLSPEGRMIPVWSFLEEQRKLREGSSAGPLTKPEEAFFRDHLSDQQDVDLGVTLKADVVTAEFGELGRDRVPIGEGLEECHDGSFLLRCETQIA
jgi:hypothetical protein